MCRSDAASSDFDEKTQNALWFLARLLYYKCEISLRIEVTRLPSFGVPTQYVLKRQRVEALSYARNGYSGLRTCCQ
jgi:hypothetical protein